MRILLVEDERMTRTALTGTLRKQGHEVIPCPDGDVAVSALDDGPYDLVLTDLNLPGPDGLTILDRVNAETPETKVMIMTAYASAETAVEALRRGAHDYLIKPFQTDELLARIQRIGQLHAVVEENRELRRLIDSTRQRRIVGDSAGMKRVIKTIDAIAPGESSVLIQGPSGTGKELVARAIHNGSPRAAGPFVAVNCTAIPETLLESELFGYRKGAFTGADRDHDGYFARAHGGSIFLDDVDDLPPNVQVKLLRVLQEREIPPVGGGAPVPVDFRLITATKEDLKELTVRGAFREDLYYRLNVIPLPLPTLAERREDIPALVRHFVSARGEEADFDFSQDRLQALLEYHWPGNVRELENVVERMLALPNVPVRDLFDGPLRGSGRPGPAAPAIPGDAVPTYREYMERCEEQLLRHALDRADGNVTTAAQLLDLPRSTLRSKLEKH